MSNSYAFTCFVSMQNKKGEVFKKKKKIFYKILKNILQIFKTLIYLKLLLDLIFFFIIICKMIIYFIFI